MYILPRMNWIHYTFHDEPSNYRTTSRPGRLLIPPETTDPFRILDISPLLPFWIIVGMATLIALLLILRRWPGLVAGIFLGCITTMCLYLFMITLHRNRKVYE
ncbi:hypothetical protein ACFFRR_010645 [Megaselia abdita]